jgi:hypothetical protein
MGTPDLNSRDTQKQAPQVLEDGEFSSTGDNQQGFALLMMTSKIKSSPP